MCTCEEIEQSRVFKSKWESWEDGVGKGSRKQLTEGDCFFLGSSTVIGSVEKRLEKGKVGGREIVGTG